MENFFLICRLLFFFQFSSIVIGQGYWYDGNLKNISSLTFDLNMKGVEDSVWEKRLRTFIELRFLEHNIRFLEDQMPKLVVDISMMDSRVERTSSFLVVFSLYNYSISETNYYRSMADTSITKNLMTSKVYSKEIIGQTSSQNLYRDVEKSINKLISTYVDQWYRDNPLKQF